MTTYTVSIGANARECGAFDGIYNMYRGAKVFSHTGIDLQDDGTLCFSIFIPLPHENEIEYFNNKPVKMFQRELENGTYSTSVRGFFTMDVVFDPSVYPDDRVDRILDGKLCMAYMVDTITDTIVGIRCFKLSDRAYKEFHKSCVKMMERGCTTYDALEGLQRYVLPVPVERLEKISVYIGRDTANIRTDNLVMLAG